MEAMKISIPGGCKQSEDRSFTFLSEPGLNVVQNCDLPPPLKLFSYPDKKFLSPPNITGKFLGEQEGEHNELHISEDCPGKGKLKLLQALRLSQTRAREAERKYAALSLEKDVLSNILMESSMQLFSYQQLLKLLELQVSMWERQQLKVDVPSNSSVSRCREPSTKSEDYDGGSGIIWIAGTGFCFAIAGIGLAFGCKYLLLYQSLK